MGYIFYDPENALVRRGAFVGKMHEILSAFAKAGGKDEICARLFASAEGMETKRHDICPKPPRSRRLKMIFPL